MSKATFYEHFANKEECLAALFEYATASFLEELIAASRGAERGFEERHSAGLRAILESIEDNPTLAQAILVETVGAGPRLAELRIATLNAFAQVMYEQTVRAAELTGGPAFASPDEAFAIVGATFELVSRQLRTGRARARARPAAAHRAADHRPAVAAAARLSERRRAARASSSARSSAAARCPRLVAWRELVAREKRAAFARRGVLGPADPRLRRPGARVLILGLAPAAHGANRTGRVFTGDRSGDFLFAALHRTGFANQPSRVHAGDGLALRDAWITAAVRCAPPANKPTPAERDTCLPYAVRELELLGGVRVDRLPRRVRLGRGAAHPRDGRAASRSRGRGRASATAPSSRRAGAPLLLGCFHPSQQNTFTGKLTAPMIDAVCCARGRSPSCGERHDARRLRRQV